MGEKGENRKADEKMHDDEENGWFLDFNILSGWFLDFNILSTAQCYVKKGRGWIMKWNGKGKQVRMLRRKTNK